MTEEDGFKVGMVGVGFVGCKVLSFAQEFFHDKFNFYWLLDSKHEIHKSDGSPFTTKEISKIMMVKKKKPRGSLEDCKNSILKARIENVEDAKDKARRVKEMPSDVGEMDVVINASSARMREAYDIEMAILHTTSLCTSNKQAWKDEKLTSKLIRTARKRELHLGLNCIAGVEANQFEYFPMALVGLREGLLILRKRDNASLNSFLKLTRDGYRPRESMSILFQKGYLEPGGGLTPTEVLDQKYKVLISAVFAKEILWRHKLSKSELEIIYPERYHDIYASTPEDIAYWVTDLEKRGERAVISSKVVLDIENKEISQQLAFRGVSHDDLISVELDGESAICMDTVDTNHLRWENIGRELNLRVMDNKKEYIFHKGPGAGAVTGKKLLEEALRICELRKRFLGEGKPYRHYLPVLQELYTYPSLAEKTIEEMESKKVFGPILAR